MKEWHPEGTKVEVLNPRPGERKCYISGWIFLDSKLFPDVGEHIWIDNHSRLTGILRDSKGKIIRAVLSKHQFYIESEKE